MSRKDIIVMSVLMNAGLIIILLVSSLTTKESYFVASSAKVAESILESNENGMLSTNKIERQSVPEKIAIVEEKVEEQPFVKLEDEIIHKLPSISIEDKKEVNAIVRNKPKENRFMEVTVKKGDSLEKIAKLSHTSISEIVKINELPNSFLRIGQTILVPKYDTVAKSKPKAKNTIRAPRDYYTVKCGDNPWTIAMKHHLKVNDLLKLNNLDSITAKKLRPGDKLRIK